MILSRKYIAILLAFAVGAIVTIGFSVHAQSAPASTSNAQAPVVKTQSAQVSDGDGEQADDAVTAPTSAKPDTDVETNDDSAQASAGKDANESDATDGSDKGEVEDGK